MGALEFIYWLGLQEPPASLITLPPWQAIVLMAAWWIAIYNLPKL